MRWDTGPLGPSLRGTGCLSPGTPGERRPGAGQRAPASRPTPQRHLVSPGRAGTGHPRKAPAPRGASALPPTSARSLTSASEEVRPAPSTTGLLRKSAQQDRPGWPRAGVQRLPEQPAEGSLSPVLGPQTPSLALPVGVSQSRKWSHRPPLLPTHKPFPKTSGWPLAPRALPVSLAWAALSPEVPLRVDLVLGAWSLRGLLPSEQLRVRDYSAHSQRGQSRPPTCRCPGRGAQPPWWTTARPWGCQITCLSP